MTDNVLPFPEHAHDALSSAVTEIGLVALKSELSPVMVLTATLIDLAIMLDMTQEQTKTTVCGGIDAVWDLRAAKLVK